MHKAVTGHVESKKLLSRQRQSNYRLKVTGTEFIVHNQGKGRLQKPNRRLTGGSVWFRPVSIVLHNDNRVEPRSTGGWVLKSPLNLG